VLLHRRRRHLKASRWPSLLALASAVLVAHLWLAGTVMPDQLGEGAAASARPRFQVSFVHELQPAAPPAAAVPTSPRPRLARLAAAPAASAALPAFPSLEQALPNEPPATVAVGASAAELAQAHSPAPPAAEAGAAAADGAAEPAQPAFDWPPSTRLTYRLTGNARGPVEGQARVEWLRSGTRYQVFLEASVGPSFAPLMSRRESSEGEITPEGLSPRRYQVEMKVLLRDARRSVILMHADEVQLPTGQTLPRPPGLQDAVSQFVHMTWLFTLRPELLTPGTSIEMPLALPRRIEPWVYEVMGSETLYTEAGAVEAVHVRPRRTARPGDYTAEMWVAPSLQNLPVRIVVRQDAETYIDLALERLPEQAERGR
jgi:Protein of unknown function (DUF3108)